MNEQEFTIYEKNGSIYSIGMKFNNLLRQSNLPAMVGGGKQKSHISTLGLPIGLSLLNNQIDDTQIHDLHERTFEGGVIKEDIYTKLLQLAEQRKTTNSKTRKRRKKKRRRKTRKY